MDILIDFDGTCVTHVNPGVGKEIGATSVLRELANSGHNLILFTMRSYTDRGLQDAIDWFRARDLPLKGVNTNPGQELWTNSPKAYGHLIIDDTALGCPLIRPLKGRPYVDWNKIRVLLVKRGYLSC